jgi:hypothetical protein
MLWFRFIAPGRTGYQSIAKSVLTGAAAMQEG